MVDLAPYLDRIIAPEDKPLFEDAVKCFSAGSLRAAYIMIWLSCAESLKRRFREAEQRDGSAGKIVGQFKRMENEHKSVDKFLLKKAEEYGFLSNSAYALLLHVYEMRCVYGHPYEEAPSNEQIIHAAAMVVDHVLSKPVRLRQGFGSELLKNLLTDVNYLDDQASAVEAFVREILPKIDESILPWLLDCCWKKMEAMADDASLRRMFMRGVWFSRGVLDHTGSTMITSDQWHEKVGKYPKTLVRVIYKKSTFGRIGGRAQDSLVGSAFDQSKDRSSVLQYIDWLSHDGALTKRQQERFSEYLASMTPDKLPSSGISMKTGFQQVIAALKTYNWYKQKPAVDFVVARGASSVKKLDNAKQEILGRNILQAADGSEKSSRKFLTVLTKDARNWPTRFISGIALECFANEQQMIRFKDDQLSKVLKILDGSSPKVRSAILDRIIKSIRGGTPKDQHFSRDMFDKIVKMIEGYDWSDDLVAALQNRQKDLVTWSDDNDE